MTDSILSAKPAPLAGGKDLGQVSGVRAGRRQEVPGAAAPGRHTAACRHGLLAAACCALAGCESLIPPPVPPPQVITESAVEIYQRPAEKALINGIRFYEEGAFDRARQSFKTALLQNLRDRRDVAVAYKYLAFISCAFNQLPDCEQYFLSAVTSDPGFVLTDAEIGHPIWGPIYRKVTGRPQPQPQR